MKKKLSLTKIAIILTCMVVFTGLAFGQKNITSEEYLQQLLKVLPEDRTIPASDQLPGTPPAHISPEDFTWRNWLTRTGELPPDFDELPFLPFLPDPLILDEGRKNIQVKTVEQWVEKRHQ